MYTYTLARTRFPERWGEKKEKELLATFTQGFRWGEHKTVMYTIYTQ